MTAELRIQRLRDFCAGKLAYSYLADDIACVLEALSVAKLALDLSGPHEKALIADAEKHRAEAVEQGARVRAAVIALDLWKSRIPHTADGHPIFLGDEVWFYEEDSREPMSAKVTSIYGKEPPGGHVYPGDFVIGAEWYEDGNTEFYHSKDAVPLDRF